MNPHFSYFHGLADDPISAISDLAKKGKKPLGYFTAYFPVELAISFGYTPVRLTGFNRECSHADANLQAYCCSLVRSSLEVGLAGDLKALEGVAFVHSCDTLQRLVDVWKHNGIHDFVPVLNFPADVTARGAFEFFQEEMKALAATFAKHSGNAFDKQALAEAIKDCNRSASLIQQVIGLQSEGKIGFSDTIAVCRAATLSDRALFADKLAEALNELGDADSSSTDGPRLVFWGGVFEKRGIADIIEEAGARVVGDVVTNISHDFMGLVDESGDPLDAVSHFYFDRPVDATKYRKGADRTERLLQVVRDNKADAVVFSLVKFCDPHAFDYPHLKRRLDEEKIPHYLFEYDMWEDGSGQASTRLEAFIEMLEE